MMTDYKTIIKKPYAGIRFFADSAYKKAQLMKMKKEIKLILERNHLPLVCFDYLRFSKNPGRTIYIDTPAKDWWCINIRTYNVPNVGELLCEFEALYEKEIK